MNAHSTLRPTLRVATMVALVVLGLSGCTVDQPAASPANDSTASGQDPTTGSPPRELDVAALGNRTWIWNPQAATEDALEVQFADGKAEILEDKFSLEQVLYADVSGDGIPDAAGQLTLTTGNAIEERWYLWIWDDPEPIQVVLPIAQGLSCGTAIESVSVVANGFKVQELRRGVNDQALSCHEVGTEQRDRTIAAAQARRGGDWWPVQVAPGAGFGGICPQTVTQQSSDHVGRFHVSPDTRSTEVTGGQRIGVFQLAKSPIFERDFPDWALAGITDSFGERCAWTERE